MNERAVAECARRYCVRLPRTRPRGTGGERLGGGTGSSLEFQDYRAYVPGDDPRHIDWAAYARRDELVVRLYREEVTPRIDLVLDASASMGSTEAKRERARELVLLVRESARADRLALVLWEAADAVERRGRDLDPEIRGWTPRRCAGLEAALRRPPRFRRNSVRIVVTDLLFPSEPRPLVRTLGREAASLSFIQVLDDEESAPTIAGGRRLTDVETGEKLDLVVTEGARRDYRRRLEAIQESYRQELRRAGGRRAPSIG